MQAETWKSSRQALPDRTKRCRLIIKDMRLKEKAISALRRITPANGWVRPSCFFMTPGADV